MSHLVSLTGKEGLFMVRCAHSAGVQALNGLARNDFPVFRDHATAIYFDSSATTQKPSIVIKAVDAYHNRAVNVGRGDYTWSAEVFQQVQWVRAAVADFIHAHSPYEVVFTTGATDSLNKICLAWGLSNLKDADEILVCADDHKSCTLPWLNLRNILQQFGITVKIIFYGVDETGKIDLYDLHSKLTAKTRVVALTHINNVYGYLNDIAEIRALLPERVVVSLDASQSIGHVDVNVQQLGVDVLSFSGHKMFASTGIGVLWVHQRLHSQLRPAYVGGGSGSSTIDLITGDFVAESMPDLLEAGTLNVAGIVSLGAAITFVTSLGIETIHHYVSDLTAYLISGLQSFEHVTFVPSKRSQGPLALSGIISLRFQGLFSAEVGDYLDQHNIFVRTGNHCMSAPGSAVEDTLRISLHLYNNAAEVDRFLEVLNTFFTGEGGG